MKKFDELKEKFKIPVFISSEVIFDIEIPTDASDIKHFISKIADEASLVEDAMHEAVDFCNDGDINSTKFTIEYRIPEAKDLQDKLSDLEDKVDELDYWGRQWKRLAQQLVLELVEEKQEEYMKNYL